MIIEIKRFCRQADYTLSTLSINSSYFCDALEDTDRNLHRLDPAEHIAKIKVKGKTAIPLGMYKIDMDTVSPRLSKSKFYQEVCGGRVPRLQDVPGFSGVLIHCGNTAADSEGCILVGMRTQQNGFITKSRDTFRHLYAAMLEAHRRGEEIWIRIIH